MKLISLALLALLCAIAPLGASPRDRAGQPRITKNEAEHIALKHFPGGRVTAAKLETVGGKLVWSIQIVPAQQAPARRVEVDAMTGRIGGTEKGKP